MAPVIVTTAPEKTPKSNRSSITDYGEDHDVSFSKYGATLGNRKLKDQLSMVCETYVLLKVFQKILNKMAYEITDRKYAL